MFSWARTAALPSVQVVVTGTEGKVRFRADCEGPVIFPHPALEGMGVLVQPNTGGEARNTFTYYKEAGKVSSLNLGPNAHFVTWVPGTEKALFNTSIGHDYRFHLIDWSTGKRLWEIPDPNPARVPGVMPPLTVAQDFLLVGGLETVQWGDRQESVRSIHALDSLTGKVVAHWLPTPLHQLSLDGGFFLHLDKKLFLVTEEEFSEIEVKDILARKNGWK